MAVVGVAGSGFWGSTLAAASASYRVVRGSSNWRVYASEEGSAHGHGDGWHDYLNQMQWWADSHAQVVLTVGCEALSRRRPLRV